MKYYNYENYETIVHAIMAMKENQDWHVVSIYPTGWRHEVCVVYYIERR